jgi:hypothetical protein
LIGYELGGPGGPHQLIVGRDILRDHYEMVVDRSAGLKLGHAAVATSALIAGVFTLATAAKPVTDLNTMPPVAKGNRLDIHPHNFLCSQSSWPYFENKCQGGDKHPASQIRQVRIVTLSTARNSDGLAANFAPVTGPSTR